MARKGYPSEFRRRALDLIAAGKTVAEVARLFEVNDQSIYTWRRQELIDRGELPGLSSGSGRSCAQRGSGSRSWRPSLPCAVVRRSCSKESVRVGCVNSVRGREGPLPA